MISALSINPALVSQLINLCAAFMLLLGFAMLTQRRILSLINLFMMQGVALFAMPDQAAQLRTEPRCLALPVPHQADRGQPQHAQAAFQGAGRARPT